MKATIFYNKKHTNFNISDPDITPAECKKNLKYIHTTITSQYFSSRKKKKKVTSITSYNIYQDKHYYVTRVESWHS